MNTQNKLNFIYCYDTNFNTQATCSIISLLDNINESINIHILHNDLSTIKKFPQAIEKHINLSKMYKYEFKHTEIKFPNLESSHVSQATYYRLFINQYIKEQYKFIVYIDADIICISDPIASIRNKITEIEKNNMLLAAKTEIEKTLTEKELEVYLKMDFFKKYWPFDRLPINNKYFNAGFMIIHLELWNKKNLFEKVLKTMFELNDKIVAWDQDVLNVAINDNYLELESKFNLLSKHYLNENDEIHFLHYYGSKKPWTTDGIFDKNSEFYHENYRKLYNKKYHIKHNWKKHSLKQLIVNILNLKIFSLKFPINFIKELLVSLIIKNKLN